MHRTQVAERHFQFARKLLLLGFGCWRQPGQVIKPAFSECAEHVLVRALPRPEPHRLANVMIRHWIKMRPPEISEPAFAQPQLVRNPHGAARRGLPDNLCGPKIRFGPVTCGFLGG